MKNNEQVFSVNRGIYRRGFAFGSRISSQSHSTKVRGLTPDRNWVHCGWNNRTHQRNTRESRVLCKMSTLRNQIWLGVFVCTCTRVGINCALQNVSLPTYKVLQVVTWLTQKTRVRDVNDKNSENKFH